MMFFWFKTKRVNIDTNSRCIGVMLIRLDVVKVVTSSFLETIVSVKLKFGSVNTVGA